MSLTHPRNPRRATRDLVVPPIFEAELARVPRDALPAGGMPPDAAYEIVRDELDGRGQRAAQPGHVLPDLGRSPSSRLMAETFDKNMIDKDEYPQTAELELRCVNMLADLWNAPDTKDVIGTSTTGSSEACMLGGLALLRRWSSASVPPGARRTAPTS